ncbi:MAG: helix-turn-helix transcriptional regulator [Alphaproteobacteria bacterium]|nr:helix-turn-helix transcriptional regulator [Alphaproteobacteria bacterium]
MTHYQVWHAIELFARAHGLSCSRLAKISGLDPTTFNKSKRLTPFGQPRWPSTSSIAKILAATGAKPQDFFKFIVNEDTDKKQLKSLSGKIEKM